MQTSRPVLFLREVYHELRLVEWPKREEVVRLTTIVIVVSVMVGSFVGMLDFVLTSSLDTLLSR